MLAAGGSSSAQPMGGPDAVRYDGDKVVRVQIRSGEDLAALEALSPDPWICRQPGIGPVDYRIPRENFGALQASGIPFRVLVEDVQSLLDAESRRIRDSRLEGGGPGGVWFNDYKDYAAISSYVDVLVGLRPSVASRISLGQSLQGREIFGIRIAAPGAPADKPAIFLHGLQHAREWITGASVMYLADRLVRTQATDPAAARALESFQFVIVPVVNPDGYAYTWTNNRLWRKNRRANPNGSTGVDLNRNWSIGWGVTPGSSGTQGNDTYRGASAFSEPETQTLRDFMSARPYIKAHFDVHSYSQLILSPWGYTRDLPPRHALFVDLNDVLRQGFLSAHGTPYVAGPTFTTIYPASGTASDWSYGARGVLGWGFELRDTGQTGFILPANQIVPTGEEMYSAVLALADAIAQPIRFTLPDGAPALVQSGQPTGVRVVISSLAGVLDAGSARLRSRVGVTGEFVSTPLTLVAGDEYLATLPAGACGARIEFAFAATANGGAPAASATIAAQTATVQDQGGTLVLTACPGCPADFSRDGVTDPDDLSDYIGAYFDPRPEAPPTDFNGDGRTDPDDLSDFISAYFAGCP